MAEKKSKAERALQALGQLAQQGWAQLEPVRKQHLAAVRAAVRQQWEAKERTQKQAEGSNVYLTLKKSRVQSRNKAKTQNKSHEESSRQSHSESKSQVQSEAHKQSQDANQLQDHELSQDHKKSQDHGQSY